MSAKKLKAPKPLTVTEEDIFRKNDEMRAELRAMMGSEIFRIATNIILKKRREVERRTESWALGSDSVVSVRMNSQRIGMEAFLDGLDILTQPIPDTESGDQASTFGAEEAVAQLAKLGVSL